MKIWRFHPEVAAEIESTARWYERERLGLGVRFALTVDAVIESLQAMPTHGIAVREMPEALQVRRVLLPRFPHAIVYVEREEEYFVVAVTHLRREPGYWFPRVDE
jgi:toxin ParE1/3/4